MVRDSTRIPIVIVLLGATFLLTVFVALRAQLAATNHRATAEKVIHDWSAVAADEFARRLENYATFYGTYPVLQTIWDAPVPPTRQTVIAGAATAEAQRNARLVNHTFRFDRRTRGVETSSAMSEDLRRWLSAEMPKAVAAASGTEQKTMHANLGGIDHTLVYAVSSQRPSAVGIDVNRDALGPFFTMAMKTMPLLPPSLSEGRIANSEIQIRVHDHDGRPVFQSKPHSDAAIAAHKAIEQGLLAGMTVDAAIDPAAADFLVIGGVPRPSTALYVTILAVSAALLVIAVLQLQRERALSRLRSDFVASVSHELRTPLTQIRMFAETLLLDRVRNEDERSRALTIIDQETRRLTQVVENVLQFSRGERGMLRIARTRCDAVAVARETIDLFGPIAAARQVNVALDGDAQLIGDFDEGALRQILLNLLDNAVKYGPPCQEVSVTVRREQQLARITVDDRGPGIPMHERRRVWKRYYRLRRERDRAIAGAGIGLSVIRELVSLHRGTARLETNVHGGLRVAIELPVEAQS